jgi:adenosylcobyric acid synthase
MINDPDGIEGAPASIAGLALLDVETTMTPDKTLRATSGATFSGAHFSGYEIHVGETNGSATTRPVLLFDDGRADGARSNDGRISGCYVHGLFNEVEVRRELLASLGAASAERDHSHDVNAALDEIANTLSRCLDLRSLETIAGLLK